MHYTNPNSRLYSKTKWIIDKILIDELINIPINKPTLTPNKTETTTSIIILTTIISTPTSITKEILIIIPIDSATSTPTQELIITVHND